MAFFNSLPFLREVQSTNSRGSIDFRVGPPMTSKEKNFYILFGGQLEKGLSQPVTSILRLIAVFK